jgi:hypothetical protein
MGSRRLKRGEGVIINTMVINIPPRWECLVEVFCSLGELASRRRITQMTGNVAGETPALPGLPLPILGRRMAP